MYRRVALLVHALLALLAHSQCGCGVCKAVTSMWSFNSCLSQYCERGDLYCENSCARCASCWDQHSQLCRANEAQCNVQYHSAKQGIISLGPSVSKAALCVWIIDLRQSRDDVDSWTLRVDINATVTHTQTSGKLVVVGYEITDGAQLFDLDGRQSRKTVFGREEALQQSHEVQFTSNYLQISFSTSSKQSSYSGFSMSWVPEESSSSSNDFLAKVISIIAVTLLIVICCGCCGICCYKIFHNFRSGRRYMISRIAPSVDRPRRMRYNEVPRDQTVIVISEENLEALIPKSKYRSDMLEVGEAVCTVCLDEFQQGTEVRKLPCKHLFHSRCIEEWLASIGNVPNCPMCKLNPFQTVIDAHISVNEVRSEHNSMMLRSDDDLVP